MFVDMLDRSWMADITDYEAEFVESMPCDHNKFLLTDHEEELLDTVPCIQDKFMNVLCSVDMDLNLKEEDMLVDPDSLA